jgi:hypothetical protein
VSVTLGEGQIPIISSKALSGNPNRGSVAATTTKEARDTPAIPLLLTINTKSMMS